MIYDDIYNTAGKRDFLRILRIAGYTVLLALFLVLASGRFRSIGTSPHDPVILLFGMALLMFSASLAMLVQKKVTGTDKKFILYWICAGLILSIQLTGGSSSIFYSAYLLFLMWVSLPATAGGATELGLVIGFTEAFSLLNASLWTSGDSFISRLMPLLLPALKVLLVPFIFGLISDWLMEKEFFSEPGFAGRKTRVQKDNSTSPAIDSNAMYPLLQFMHNHSKADSTCLFIRNDDGFFRLEKYVSNDENVISRFMLPSQHRLTRIAENSSKTVSVRVNSKEELVELAPYHFSGSLGKEYLWITLFPLRDSGVLEGFLLQDFSGETPSDNIIADVERLSGILHGTGGSHSFSTLNEYTLMTKLVSACNESDLNKAVRGMAGILAEMIPDSTVSIADVDSQHLNTRVWVSRGPLALWRRGKVFDGKAGIAGWIVKNRVPCRRSGIGHGEKSVYAFSAEAGLHSRAGSCMGVPVLRDEKVIALIMAEHEDENAFMQHHESILLAVAGMFSMRVELSELRQRFLNISGRDVLTGLPGITLLDSHLHHLAKEVQNYGWYVGVLVADLDGFGSLNQKLGYTGGDRLLASAADRFRNCFSDDAFIARIGPDSFAACIPRAGKAVMEAMSQRAADALSFEYTGGSSSATVSASIGAAYTHVNRKVLLLTGEAEKAVSEASAGGPGTCKIRKIGLSIPEKE